MWTVGSLFSGIGGIDLGLERAGMTVRWQAEVDPYCCKVLKKHWPHTPNLGDVRVVDWHGVERVTLVCGGYPCQPFSYAGGRGGESDPRHVWPYFAECLRVLRPPYALLENVPGHLSLGFGRVLGDLAELGYDTEWDCIPAAAVGAPHERYRVFVVAHADGEGQPGVAVDEQPLPRRLVPDSDGGGLRPERHAGGQPAAPVAADDGPQERLADADGPRRQPPATVAGASDQAPGGGEAGPGGRGGAVADSDDVGRDGRSRFLGARGGRQLADSGWWTAEPDVGRVAHGIPSRVDRLRGLGNAVVPQVAEWIGTRLLERVG